MKNATWKEEQREEEQEETEGASRNLGLRALPSTPANATIPRSAAAKASSWVDE
jgi:hypothetical protein